MRKEDRQKLTKAGIRIYQKDAALRVIRKWQQDRFIIVARPRTKEGLKRKFDEFMKDPMAIREGMK